MGEVREQKKQWQTIQQIREAHQEDLWIIGGDLNAKMTINDQE